MSGEPPAAPPGTPPATPPAAPPGTPPAAPPQNWRASLPDDLRDHAAIKDLADIPALVKSHINAQSVISSRGITVPTKPDAPPEEFAKVYDALGRPKEATGYVFAEIKDRPYTDADKQFQSSFAQVAHKAGISQKGMDEIAGWWNGMQGQLESNSAKVLTEATAQLKTDWGDKFDANMDGANRALKSVAQAAGISVEEFKQIRLMDGSYLGDNPMMVRVFAAVGGQLGETPFNGGPPGAGRGDPFASPVAAKAEVDRLYAEDFTKSDHAYNNKRHPQHKWWVDRVMMLEALAQQAPRK